MARSKSLSGGTSGRKGKNSIANPADLPELNAVAAETSVATETKPENGQRDNGKFEVMRSDARANVVPINLENEIRQRAYELYEQRGYANGHETEDWLSAEREVLARYRQQSA